MSKYQIGFINKKRKVYNLIGIYISESGKLDKFVAPPGVPIIDTTKIASSSWAKAIKGHLSVAGCVEIQELIEKLLSVGGVLLPTQDDDERDHEDTIKSILSDMHPY